MESNSNNKKLISIIFKKKIFSLIFIILSISIAIFYNIDKKIIIFVTFFFSIFTEIFAGFSILIAAIPIIGPFLIKVVTIPIFWILNATGYIVSAIAIKKGFTTELAKGRIVTLALLIGIIIGYITGNMIPLK